ncbi:MAG TPA: hypothetical protein PKD47_00650 [Solirubrobacterales bacterium]|nr:hypothetical protein [Solirubrobacterales bacterium]
MSRFRKAAADLAPVAGLACIVYGLFLWSAPAGFIAGGLALVVVGLALAFTEDTPARAGS